jgi:hypothetical protein
MHLEALLRSIRCPVFELFAVDLKYERLKLLLSFFHSERDFESEDCMLLGNG